MTINDLINERESKYSIISNDSRDTAEVARSMIINHLVKHSNNIVWAFHRTGPFGLIQVRDGVNLANPEEYVVAKEYNLSVSRTYGRRNWFPRRLIVPVSEYLQRTQDVYLQLCGIEDLRAGGIERTDQGSQIGSYDFGIPLL